MKPKYAPLLLLLALGAAAPARAKGGGEQTASSPANTPDPGWPRELNKDGARLIYNQPQIDEWKNYRQLRVKVAFSVTPKDGKSVVGVAELEGATIADMENRTVSIENLKISTVRFPAVAPEETATMEALVKRVFPGKSLTISLDRVLSGLEDRTAANQPVEVKMDPPAIFVSERPASLLIVDGKPIHAPLGDTKLEFVVNTNWDVFFDPAAGKYYLLNDKLWLTSASISGGWTLASSVPAALSKVPEDWSYVKKSLPVKVENGTRVPAIVSSDKPAELIVFHGAPTFQKVPGTSGLMWAGNTESWIFQDKADSQFYYLVSGRWFRAASLTGPWSYAGNDLPEDFKLIPPNHPCADVLSSVPGTVEAQDAVMLAGIPVQASINIAGAEGKAAAAYDGDPDFTPIDGTSMSYARNSASTVIKVENRYYLCQNAVWFVSSAAAGPWKICGDVPQVIYTIPVSCPVHNVTYVRVESAPAPGATTVTCSYTAGYYGAFIAGMAVNAILVNGSGYYYPPYVYYGYGARPVYRPVCYPSYGVAAVYNPWTGGYAVGQKWYGPYASAGRAAWYNPATGNYGRAVSVQTPYGGRTAAAGYNPRTDTAWATRQGSNGYAQWGTTAVSRGNKDLRVGHVITDEGGAVRWKSDQGGGKVRWTDDGAAGVAHRNGNLYVGKDGNVYRRDQNGDWNKYGDGGSWNPADVPNNRPDNGKGRPTTLPASTPGSDRKAAADPAGRPATMDRTPGKVLPTSPDKALPGKAQPSTQPLPRPAPYTPPADVADSLRHDAAARSRGDAQTSRRQGVSNRGAATPSTTSRTLNRATPGSAATGTTGVRRR